MSGRDANGETYVQACVVTAIPTDTTLNAADIGANQGDWSLSLLRAVPPGRRRRGNLRLELFEPVPATIERLEKALARDELAKNARIHRLAVSDKEGKVSIAVMSGTGGTNTLHPENDRDAPPGGWVAVDTTTLSRFAEQQGIARIHLAKCDAEGHDLAVLRGARGLMESDRIDVLQFEYNHRWVFSRSYLRDVFSLIDGLPYTLGRVMPAHIEVFDQWHPELERYFEANYVLVHARALGWFDVHRACFNESNVIEERGRIPNERSPVSPFEALRKTSMT
jgi:FkbM family methyltransferase